MEDTSRDLHDADLNSLVPDVRVDRRGFVAACLAAGFAVSAEPVLAQAIKTPMDGLDGGDTKIGDIPAYYAVPKGGGKRPVVLVVAEVFGLHEHIKDVVRRVAKEGYFAVANEPYFRIGELWKLEDLKQVIAGANQLSDEQAFKDLDAVVAWAGKNPRANTDKMGITGFCRGACTARPSPSSTPAARGPAASARPSRRSRPRRSMRSRSCTGRCSASTAAPTRASRKTRSTSWSTL